MQPLESPGNKTESRSVLILVYTPDLHLPCLHCWVCDRRDPQTQCWQLEAVVWITTWTGSDAFGDGESQSDILS